MQRQRVRARTGRTPTSGPSTPTDGNANKALWMRLRRVSHLTGGTATLAAFSSNGPINEIQPLSGTIDNASFHYYVQVEPTGGDGDWPNAQDLSVRMIGIRYEF